MRTFGFSGEKLIIRLAGGVAAFSGRYMMSLMFAAPAPVPTQYLFMLWWYNNKRPAIAANQMQTVPLGGWKNWTQQHNVAWIVSQIERRAKFVLLGDHDDLMAQANNAGSGKNQCVIGMEILLLLDAGYTRREPNPGNADESFDGTIWVFEPPPGTPSVNAMFVLRCNYSDLRTGIDPSHTDGFWDSSLKNAYLAALKF